MSNLFKRTITGILFVVAVITSIISGPFVFSGLFFIFMVIGTWEFYKLAERDDVSIQKIPGILTAIALYTLCVLSLTGIVPFYTLLLILILLYALFIYELYTRKPKPISNIAYTIIGVIYVALPFSLLNALAFLSGKGMYSSHLLLGYFFILWTNDTGAYIAGNILGRNKLFERISPKKTWEGSIGGLILSMIVASFVSAYYHDLSMLQWIVMAFVIVVTSTLGDLTESLFKRGADCKDSGNILPGHGGVLDRFDGLLLSVPFVYMYLYFFT